MLYEDGTVNDVRLSPDRRDMVVRAPSGHRASIRSKRDGGFTDVEVEAARHLMPRVMQPGQVDRMFRRHLWGRTWYLSVNTGPPTWWLPQMMLRPRNLMVGWLRGMVALSWRVEGRD